MSDNLTILGEDYTGVTGIKATETNSGNTLVFVRPQGAKSITQNGTGIDVAAYATADVNVSVAPNLQAKTNIAPTTSSQTITADSGYDGLSSVQINAMPQGTALPPEEISATGATVTTGNGVLTLRKNVSVTPDVVSGYISSGTEDTIPILLSASMSINSSSSLTVSGATVTAPAGYYASNASKAIANGTAGTPIATKGTMSDHSISVTPSVTNTTGYITGSTKTGTAVSVSASELVSGTLTISSSGTKDVTNYASASVAAGSATPASVISGTGADVDRDGTTLYLSKTVSNTPQVTAGYVSSGTAGNSFIELTATDSNWTAANIKKDVSIFGLTGTYEGSGGGGMTLLKSTSLGTLTTSSTSAADTGKTMTVTGYNDYDVLVVDVSVDSPANNRHTSTVSMVYLTGTSNVSTKNTYAVGSNKWNSRLGSTGTGSTRQSTTAYGIYVNAATVSSSTMTLTFYYRYNSNNTGTINGTYTARAYGLKLYDLIGG